MYAIKVRPPTATAWFWLSGHPLPVTRPNDQAFLTTLRARAALFADADAATTTARRLVDWPEFQFVVVKIGGGHHL